MLRKKKQEKKSQFASTIEIIKMDSWEKVRLITAKQHSTSNNRQVGHISQGCSSCLEIDRVLIGPSNAVGFPRIGYVPAELCCIRVVMIPFWCTGTFGQGRVTQ
jgi:hypothetical protein